MSLLEQWLSESHLKALAAMLFHSIWQGVLLAAAAATVLLLTKRASAVLRYNLLVMLLFIFAAGAVYTYWTHLSGSSKIFEAVGEVTQLNEQQLQSQPLYSGDAVTGLIAVFQSHASLIVFCWLLLIFSRLCYLLTGYYAAHRLVREKLVAAPHQWTQRWTSLLGRMNIRANVGLMESALAKVPMVIGHFKPLVLIPAGMLMSLPPAQAEAILLHELAHIKRRDYLLNLMQQTVQCIFFFHPAVSWVCSLISEEREHCCDDVAAACNGDKHAYIQALVSFYEYSLPPATALAFGGRKRSLIDRIKRLIHHQNKTLNIMEKIFLTVALVIAGFVLQSFYHNGTNVGTGITGQVTDTIPKEKLEMSWTEDRKNFRAIFQNNQLAELYVDGKKIPPERLKEFQPVLDRMHNNREAARTDAARAKDDAEEARRDAEEIRREAMREARRANKEREEIREGDRSDDLEELNLTEAKVEKIVQEAMREAEEALQELQKEGVNEQKLEQELHSALQAAKQGLQKAQRELQEQKGRHQQEMSRSSEDHALVQITQEAVQLALNAATLGLQEANVELQESLKESGKMDKKEYRERKRQLREAYRNSQRSGN